MWYNWRELKPMQRSASLASSSSCSNLITSCSSDASDADLTPSTSTSTATSISSSTYASSSSLTTPPECCWRFHIGRGFAFTLVPWKRLSKPCRRAKKIDLQTSQKRPLYSSTNQRARKFCSCAAGICADCIAICCCPLVLLHLLALVVFKLPSTTAKRLIAAISKKLARRMSCSDTESEDGLQQPSILYPCKSCMNDSTENVLHQVSHLELQDERFLREYFECKQFGFGVLES